VLRRGVGWAAGAVALALLAGCGPPAWLGAGSSRPPSTGPAPSSAPSSSPAPAPRTVTVLAAGDVLIHQDLELTEGARLPGGGYDFSGVLAPVAPLVRGADLAICHLETPVAPPGGPFRGYPTFDVQPQIVTALAGAGFDVCSTSSNHSLDDGFGGLVRTLDTLDAAGIRHSGSYRSQPESLTPTILDVHGVRIAEVAGTYGLNGGGPPAAEPWSVHVEHVPDVSGLLAGAARARAAGAQIVVVSLHCCVEYQHQPTAAQVEAVHRLLASPDVDLVVGHHAHVVQPFEEVGGKWVAYGLGNFVAEMAREGDPYDEVAARFTFTRGPDGRFAVTKAEAIPLHVQVDPSDVRVVPADPEVFARVAAVVDSRGGQAAGLQVVHG
jgi:poly-gamma-glutamate capsule biosynthesis protein CapA/YwtB (metallophosphatase superfamily)